jgi:hypothetical protein
MAAYQTHRYRCLALLVSSYRKISPIQIVIFCLKRAHEHLQGYEPRAKENNNENRIHRPGQYGRAHGP